MDADGDRVFPGTGVEMNPVDGDTVEGDGSGEALPPIDFVET